VKLQRTPIRIPIAVRIVAGLLVLVIVGTTLLLAPGMTTRPLRPIDAFFTAVSALSVTGLSTITPALDLTLLGQLTLMALIQIGGVGFMAAAAIAVSVLGQRMSLSNRLALSDSLGLLTTRMVVQLTGRAFLGVFVIEMIGATLLYVHWRDQLGQQAFFYALFHAVSAFCNAGFDLFLGLPGYPTGLPSDSFTLLILGSLILLGGLGIPVLADLLTIRQHAPTVHTRLTLVITAGLVIIGAFTIWLGERQPGAVLAQESFGRQFELALFQSVSARTAGFGGIQPFERLSQASQLIMIILMFIGCAPASMGGGITTGTFGVVVLACFAYIRRQPTVQFAGRSIPLEQVRRAVAVLVVSLAVVLFGAWLLLLTHPFTLAEALFETVSAFATCGLSLAITARLEPIGLLIVAGMMFWGRVGALTLVLALARPAIAQPFQYPEEQILLG
jgi:trk system potassium uptake protein